MPERTGGTDRGIIRFTSALRRRVDTARGRLTGATAAEKSRTHSLVEAREQALENPTYRVLRANVDFQNWMDGKKVPLHRFLEDDFTHIRDNVPVNPYQEDSVWLEKAIDPTVDKSKLKEKCIEYCRETSSHFIETATSMARLLCRGDEPMQDDMQYAIRQLIGTSVYDEDTTIFKNQSWNVADYTPDFKRLGVDLEEADISEEKVMAGVELSIGLWVRLADLGAQRPVSGKNFDPPFDHCSFTDLVDRSGWTTYTDSDGIFLDAALDRVDPEGRSKREEFLSQFRSPDFFRRTYEALTRPESSQTPAE